VTIFKCEGQKKCNCNRFGYQSIINTDFYDFSIYAIALVSVEQIASNTKECVSMYFPTPWNFITNMSQYIILSTPFWFGSEIKDYIL